MTFFAIYCNHRKESSPIVKSKLFHHFLWPCQVVYTCKAIDSWQPGMMQCSYKRETEGFRGPNKCFRHIFTGKSFGTNIQTGIITGISLIKMKDIETDTLLSFRISFNKNIAVFPFVIPLVPVRIK